MPKGVHVSQETRNFIYELMIHENLNALQVFHRRFRDDDRVITLAHLQKLVNIQRSIKLSRCLNRLIFSWLLWRDSYFITYLLIFIKNYWKSIEDDIIYSFCCISNFRQWAYKLNNLMKTSFLCLLYYAIIYL